MVGLDCAVLQSDTVHVVAGGLARGLPVAQAIAVATGNEVRGVSHLLGGLPPTSRERSDRDRGDVCLVREPPLPGRWLPYAPIESDTVESLVDPVATLGGRRATRAWVQRAVTAVAGVPVPRLLHFTGHGTVGLLPSGEAASAILLADAELLTPGDLAVVEAGIRTFVCAACDIAVASMHGGHDLAVAALRSGVEHVVAAAWPVDDAVTTVLVTRAYHEWTAGSVELGLAVHAAAHWWRTNHSDDILEFVAGLPGGGELEAHLAPRLTSPNRELRDGDFWAAFGTYVA
jgi:CHAT domain-containing protein